jgi:hypothetical protein
VPSDSAAANSSEASEAGRCPLKLLTYYGGCEDECFGKRFLGRTAIGFISSRVFSHGAAFNRYYGVHTSELSIHGSTSSWVR